MQPKTHRWCKNDDNHTLNRLINKGEADLGNLKTEYIDSIHLKHFCNHDKKHGHNFCKYAAEHIVASKARGARARLSGEGHKETKCI